MTSPTKGAAGQAKAAANPLATLKPSSIAEFLKISTDKNAWINRVNLVTRDSMRIDPPLGPLDVQVKVRYSSLTTITPEPTYPLQQQQVATVLLQPGVEVVGHIVAKGSQLPDNILGTPVLCFKLGSDCTGPITETVFPFIQNVFAIPSPDPGYLSACTPMISSDIIFGQYLNHLDPKTSHIFVNHSLTGTGMAICQQGHRLGFSMYALCYNPNKEDIVPFSRQDMYYQHKLGAENRTEQVLGECVDKAGYSAVVTPAILSPDALGIYKLFANVLKRGGYLIILCTKELISAAADRCITLMPHELFGSRQISLQWVALDSEVDYSPVILRNLEKFKKPGPSKFRSVTCKKPVAVGLSSVREIEAALGEAIVGTNIGYQYLEL